MPHQILKRLRKSASVLLASAVFIAASACGQVDRSNESAAARSSTPSAASTTIYGQWRALTNGPMGEDLINLSISEGVGDEPLSIALNGHLGPIGDLLPPQNIQATNTTLNANLLVMSFDVGGFVSGPTKLEAKLLGDGDYLRVVFSNHVRDINIVFERNGPKFERFDAPRLSSDGERATAYYYAPPGWRVGDNDIEVADFASVGVDPSPFEKIVREDILSGAYPELSSLLVVKDGKLVMEEYFYGEHADFRHNAASVSKSFAAILYGIMLNEGALPSLNTPLAQILPNYNDTVLLQEKPDTTALDFLLMKNYWGWNENDIPYRDPENMFGQSLMQPDMFRHMFNRDLIDLETSQPYAYNTIMTHALGLIMMNQSGKNLDSLINEKLFKPMNSPHAYFGAITPFPLSEDKALAWAGSTLQIRPRDMAKFGLMLLNGGAWQGKQVVPVDWVRQATAVQVLKDDSGTATGAYGYQFHIRKVSNGDKAFWAVYCAGYGGQFIVMIPELNAVFVTTANNYAGEGKKVSDLVLNRLVTALTGGDQPFNAQPLTSADLGTVLLQ